MDQARHLCKVRDREAGTHGSGPTAQYLFLQRGTLTYPAHLTVHVGPKQDCGVHAVPLEERMAVSTEKILQTVGPFAQMPPGPDPGCQQGAWKGCEPTELLEGPGPPCAEH